MATADELHPLERKVLPILSNHHAFDRIVAESGLQEIEVMRAIQWLTNKGLAKVHETVVETAVLEKNGEEYRKSGLPEKRFLSVLSSSMTLEEIGTAASLSDDELKVCIGILRSRSAIKITKEGKLAINITENGRKLLQNGFLEENFLRNTFPLDVKKLREDEIMAFENLKKRKNIVRSELSKILNIELTAEGKRLLTENLDEALVEKLTPQLIKTGLYKGRKFRRYDVKSKVPLIHGGRRHFVDQSINYIKRIWLDLGFKEMQGNLVQTSFWDLDSLFVPQDHPARDMQDTFYIKEPKYGSLPPLHKHVKACHEDGWTTGSKGWRYKWSETAAKENLLRTHTTVLSAQTIAALKKEQIPAKFFSVKKVFRNEALSWKHLFEFIQVEGIVVDREANFKNLKGYLREFFRKMGFADVRIRPGHFPYTEPSAEVDVWHPVRKTWVELGGSGIFRPEVTKPLLGEEIPVLAWGIGMERTIMEYYGIKDVRELYQNDIKQLREIKLWNR